MFIDFIKNHYELIIACVFLLSSFVVALLKKKPVFNKLDEIKNFILENLPSLINSVESPGNGSTKKDLVIAELKVLLAKKFNFYQFNDILPFISLAIEAILSTPTKHKED